MAVLLELQLGGTVVSMVRKVGKCCWVHCENIMSVFSTPLERYTIECISGENSVRRDGQ